MAGRDMSVFVNIGGRVAPSLAASIGTAKGMIGTLSAAYARTNKTINAMAAATESAGKRMQAAGRSLSSSISAPLGLIGLGAAKLAFNFELAGNKLEALGDASAKQRVEFESFANVLNKKYPQSLSGIIDTGNEMLKGGFNFEQMKGAIDQTLATAVLGDMSPAEVGNMMSRTIQSFQLPMKTYQDAMKSSSRVSDQMTFAAVRTTASLKDMGEMYRYVGGASSAAGIPLEQATAFAMAFAKNGSVGSDAGVAMRSAIVRMVKMPKQGLAAMSRIGMNLKDYQGGSRKVTAGNVISGLQADGIDATGMQSQIARALDSKANKNPAALSAAITRIVQSGLKSAGSAMDASVIAQSVQESVIAAGSKVDLVRFFTDLKKKMDAGKAGLGDVATILEGRHASRYMAVLQSDLKALIEDVTKNSAGYTQSRYGTILKGIVGPVYGLSAAVEKLSVSFGRALFPDLAVGVTAVSDAVDGLSATSPGLLRFAGGAGLAAVALGPFLLLGGATVRAVGLLAQGLLLLGNAATLGLAARLLATARGIAAISIAATVGLARRIALSAGALMTLGRVGGMSAILGAASASIGALGLSVLRFPLVALRAVSVAMWGLVANPVGLTITAIVVALTALGTWVANNWGGLRSFFVAFGEGFMKALGPQAAANVQGVVNAVKSVWAWFSKLLGPLDAGGAKWKAWGEAAGAGAAAVVTALSGLPGKIAGLLIDFKWSEVGAAIGNKLKDGISGIGSSIGDAAGSALGGIKSRATALKDKLFGPSVPGRYAGGPVSAGMPYIVGERGPELFVPSSNGSIRTNGFLNGLGGPTVDASAVARTRALANETGMVLHTSLDAVRKPIVDTSSIDEAALKVSALGSALGGLGGSLGGGGGGGSGGGGGGGSWNGKALAVGQGAGIGHTASKAERAEFIQSYAKSIGIDPTTALRVAQSEGFNKYTGDQGRSFGDFQLFTGGGVGNRALKAGINVRDPRQWKAADRYALDTAKREGWSQWHGARRAGIGNRQGISSGNPAISRMTDPAAVARMRGRGRGDVIHNHNGDSHHSPSFTIHVPGGDVHKVKAQVESHFWEMVRQAERDQAGSLSD